MLRTSLRIDERQTVHVIDEFLSSNAQDFIEDVWMTDSTVPMMVIPEQ